MLNAAADWMVTRMATTNRASFLSMVCDMRARAGCLLESEGARESGRKDRGGMRERVGGWLLAGNRKHGRHQSRKCCRMVCVWLVGCGVGLNISFRIASGRVEGKRARERDSPGTI